MIEAVYQAQREALEMPEDDRQIRYLEHKPEYFAVPSGKSDNCTFVGIITFPGRSLEAKRNLCRAIVRRFGELGIEAEDVFVVLHEPALENRAYAAGSPRRRSTSGSTSAYEGLSGARLWRAPERAQVEREGNDERESRAPEIEAANAFFRRRLRSLREVLQSHANGVLWPVDL